MASDQLTGADVAIYAVSPNGDEKRLFVGVNEQTGPGGSPDGVQATVKDNELPFMPVNGFTVVAGWRVVAKVRMKAADGSDASDAVINLPYISKGGGLQFLTRTDLGFSTDLPAASVANVWHQLGAGKTVPEGEAWNIGGGKYFISIENDV